MAYVKHNWVPSEVISEALLDHLETQYDEAVASDIVFTELVGGQDRHVGAAATWTDWDISAIVPAGTKSVIVAMVNIDTVNVKSAGARKNGSALDRRGTLPLTAGAAESWDFSLLTECDANRVIEIYAQTDASIHFNILGYWSPA